MTPSTEWEVVRHHVSICGRVLDKDRKPMFGVQVSVLQDAKQAEPQPKSRGVGTRRELEEIGKVTRVWKQTESRADGTFFLLDCPDGHYTITALDARSGIQSSKSISVAENAMKKRMKDRGTEEGYQIELVLKK